MNMKSMLDTLKTQIKKESPNEGTETVFFYFHDSTPVISDKKRIPE